MRASRRRPQVRRSGGGGRAGLRIAVLVLLAALGGAGAAWALREQVDLPDATPLNVEPTVAAVAASRTPPPTTQPAQLKPALGGQVGVLGPTPAPQPTAAATPRPQAPSTAKPAAPPRAPVASRAPAAPTATLLPPNRFPWQQTSPTQVQHDEELAVALEGVLQGVDGTIGLAVKDLATGRGVLLNATQEMPAASLFKVPVMVSVMRAGVPLSESLAITERIKDYDLGSLELDVGDTLTVAEALERMVTISDNSSAILLADRVSATRVNADLRAAGMTSTFYLADRLNTSAGDMARLLESIARGQAASPELSAEMVHLLLRQKVRDRIPRLLPRDARVANKTGNLPDVVNDVAIVYGPRSTFVIAALVSETSNLNAATLAIANAAEVAYEHFEALPAVASRPTVPPQPQRPVPPVRRAVTPRPTVQATATPTASATMAPTGSSVPLPTARTTGIRTPPTPAPTGWR